MSAKQKRNGLRMCVQREMEKIAPMINGETPVDVRQLQVSVAKLTGYQPKCQAVDDLVLQEIGDGDIEAEIFESANYTDELLDIIAQASLLINNASETQQSETKASGTTPGDDVKGRQPQLRLPKLEIRAFSGDALEWQGFWDSFDSSVHSNSKLSPIDKFSYLKSLLSGEALKAIDGYRLTAANYDAVLATLNERFGDKQVAIFAHFEAILALPQASQDIAQLQSVADTCERHIRSLVALGLDESTFGQVFTPIMLSKLPNNVKTELHRRNGSQTWSLANLREWLKDEIRAREMGQRSFAQAQPRSKYTNIDTKPEGNSNNWKSTQRPNGSRPQSTTSALVSSATGNDIKCAFCGKKHYSDQCTEYVDVASRQKKLGSNCYKCLGSGHRSKDCRRQKSCVHCKKSGHHSSLCYSKSGKSSKPSSTPKAETGLNVDVTPLQTTSDKDQDSGNVRTILQTALTSLVPVGGEHSVEARLLFDTAGSRSFITERKRVELELPVIGYDWSSIAGFQATKRKVQKLEIVEFNVRCLDGSLQYVKARVVPTITCPVQKIPIDTEVHTLLKSVTLSEPLIDQPEFVEIDVLIGLEHYYKFVNTERIECPNGPLLLSSRLGYIATGPVATDATGPETIAVMLLNSGSTGCTEDLSVISLEKFWNLEDIGIKEGPRELSGDDEALSFHTKTLTRGEDGRYSSRWPWKVESPELPDNYNVASRRLNSLIKQFSSNPTVFKSYGDTISDQLKKGVIEEASSLPTGPVYYMPHHCVLTPGKTTTKIRVVYDASSKARKEFPSLNDCLHRGPVLLDDLCGLLMRFRLQKIALVSDIEKAFLQIALQEVDRDVTRFLWVKDVNKPPAGDNLIVYRFCRVPFGIISSPFVLANTICQHLTQTGGSVASKMLKNHYVDNVVTGEMNVEDAISHYEEAKSIFRSACMNLREWFTNSDKVREVFADADRGKDLEPKVLGLRWNPKTDELRCSSCPISDSAPVTKRSILKTVAQVFDPLGFFAPVSVAGKMLIQELWKSGFGWDEVLPETVTKRWFKIRSSLEDISVSGIPRFVGAMETGGDLQLHVFCDASERASAAVVYLRKCDSRGVYSDILFAKSRLAPVKQKQTIPRLELIAVVIGVRILEFVRDQLQLPISGEFVWTDSQCTLHWIRNERVNTRFVENRLKEIRKHSNVEFGYVPTKENPADLPSRGCDINSLTQSSLWWHGPCWLVHEPGSWPVFESAAVSAVQDELILVENTTEVVVPSVVDATRFSSLTKLLRCTAYVQRFIHNLRSAKADRRVGLLQAEELSMARLQWHRWAQSEGYPDLVNFRGSTWPRGIGRQLNLFKDSDNILRCGGRISASDLPYDAKYPVLLSKNSRFTLLVIADSHRLTLHSGLAQTLTHLRQRYWVVHGRNTVRKVIHQCNQCRRVEGGPYRVPAVPALPKSRVGVEPAFACTGLDYMGPLWIKRHDGSNQKVWICLYTCMVVRAVFLDVVDDLSAEQFLMSLRRFISLYGVPKVIVSDNASQLRVSSKCMDTFWRDEVPYADVQNFATNSGIQWKFITEHAPWMGGFYERLVGLVKRALKKSLDGVLSTSVELRTVVCEIAGVLNSRPLVYLDNDVTAQPLTPSHFLALGGRFGPPDVPSTDEFFQRMGSVDILRNKWRRLQVMVGKFWDTWRRQYLTSLRERSVSNKQRNCSSVTPSEGSVVQISDNVPRGQWRLGRIVKLLRSEDGNVRSANLRLVNGKHVNRPIKLLYPLEAQVTEPVSAVEDTPPVPIDVPTGFRPKRRAAAVAESAWRQQLLSESDEQ